MPFKDRMKRAFGRNSSSGRQDSYNSLTLAKTSSRKASNVYQPGEPMPRMKYRQPVEKKHKEHLEAFTFAGNVRRNSLGSTYSPMGSKWPSRNPSCVDLSTYGYGTRRHPPPNVLADLDLAALSLADRKDSEDSKAVQHVENVSDTSSDTVEIASPQSSLGSMAPDHRPFTAADLNQALKRSGSVAVSS